MYAVYGLNKAKDEIEAFLGYVPATFFEAFTEPSLWSVETIVLANGKEKIGRLYGRAFFVPAVHLRANHVLIAEYMGETSPHHMLDSTTPVV